MTYNLYYQNFGNQIAENVVLVDTLPNNVEFNSASYGGIYNNSNRTVTWNLGSVLPKGYGSTNLTVYIPTSVSVGTGITNNANISTSSFEVYTNQQTQINTPVTQNPFPQGVDIEPNYGGIGTPSVNWHNSETFSYHNTGLPVTGVNITIHSYDGLPDIEDTMTSIDNSNTDWIYTFTPYPRHGECTVSYTKQIASVPYNNPNYDIRGNYGGFITADDIYSYIKKNYPQSPMLSEPDIGSRFKNASSVYGIDPVVLVAFAEVGSQFGTIGWGANNPEAHNAFLYGVYDDNTTVNQNNSASSWGDMVDRVACAIATGPNYFTQGRYTIGAIIEASLANNSSQNLNLVSSSKGALSIAYDPIYGYYVLGITAMTFPIVEEAAAVMGMGVVCPACAGVLLVGITAIEVTHIAAQLAETNSEHISNSALNNLLLPGNIIQKVLKFLFYIDPAGYIYDVNTGTHIANSTVWLQQPDGLGSWKNVPTGPDIIPPIAQPNVNPLVSDVAGDYQWDTLPGAYRVNVTAPGYKPANSIVVSVPPPVEDLDVGLHQIIDSNNPPFFQLQTSVPM